MVVSVATLQTVWDCHWSRVGRRMRGVGEHRRPEALWVCVRPPAPRRSVTEAQCERCQFWEAGDPDPSVSDR